MKNNRIFGSSRNCWSASVVLAVLSVVLVLVPVRGHTSKEYCDKFQPENIMCLYPKDINGCSIKKSGIDNATIDDIISTINKYRQEVANGQLPASNMYEMTWNEELATMAQRWASVCKFDRHDENRDAFAFPDGVGQLCYTIHSLTLTDVPDFKSDVIPLWYSQGFNLDSSVIDSYEHGVAEDYTQLVWAKTYAVGCGFIYTEDEDKQTKYYVCNFGPIGNVLDEPVYKTGNPCSACESNGKCSTKYDGLCTPPTDTPGTKQKRENTNFLT